MRTAPPASAWSSAATVHLFHFNEQGLVQRFRHACDTWQWAKSLSAA